MVTLVMHHYGFPWCATVQTVMRHRGVGSGGYYFKVGDPRSLSKRCILPFIKLLHSISIHLLQIMSHTTWTIDQPVEKYIQ
jgi:hypothetical protein